MASVAHEPVEQLIVGGGVIGLALAFELLCRGRSVLVLERGEPGGGASDVAAGMLAPVSEADTGPDAVVALGQESLRRYPEFVERVEERSGIDCAYRTEGMLWVAVNRDERAELEHIEGTLLGKGLEARRLSAAQVLEREPHLSPRVTGGLLVPGDHQVDPRSLLRSLVGAIRAMGGRIEAGRTVERIDARGGVHGQDREGRPFAYRAQQVVLAAGAWGEEISLPLPPLGLRPVKGQLVRLRGTPLVHHLLRTPEVYLVPRTEGELLIGATAEEMGFDEAPTAGAVLDLLRHAWELLPGIYDLQLSEINVGLRPALLDHLPSIGPTHVDGLYLAVGHFRHGILLAPATAHYLAELLERGETPAALQPFQPGRFDEEGDPSRLAGEEA
jgi:glycine oxidase